MQSKTHVNGWLNEYNHILSILSMRLKFFFSNCIQITSLPSNFALHQPRLCDYCCWQWHSHESQLGALTPSSSLSLPLPLTSTLFSPISPPFLLRLLPLRYWTLKIQLALLSPEGSGAEPQPKSNLVHYIFKVWDLLATILIIFLRINWPKLVQLKRVTVLSGELGGTWAP